MNAHWWREKQMTTHSWRNVRIVQLKMAESIETEHGGVSMDTAEVDDDDWLVKRMRV